MLRLAPQFKSPVHQALWATGVMAVFGVAVRFVWGAFDPEMRRWTFVALAPLMGMFVYLRATGRGRTIAIGLIGLGLGGLVFWSLILFGGRMPVTGRADYFYIAIILSIPVACVVLGWRQLRRIAMTGH